MKASIDRAVFKSTEVDASDLVSLFQLALRGRHAVFPDPLEGPEIEAWLAQRDLQIREECRFAIDSSVDQDRRFPAPVKVRITLTRKPRWNEPAELSLKDALSFLQRPLDIVVENGRNDRAFLFAVASSDQCDVLERALEENRIRFEHGGGLQEMTERLEDLKGEHSRTRRSYWIFDSDALAPGRPSPDSHDLLKRCHRYRVAAHRLERRCAESYLPPPAIRDYWARNDAKRKKKARAFEQLEPRQRHHFNMKNGLNGDEKQLEDYKRRRKTSGLADAAEDLYGDLPPGTRYVLASGFGRKVRGLFAEEGVLHRSDWFGQDGAWAEIHPMIEELIGHI